MHAALRSQVTTVMCIMTVALCPTSVAAAKPAKHWRERGVSNQGGKAPSAAAAPLLAATLGSVSNPRYLSVVLCTASAFPA